MKLKTYFGSLAQTQRLVWVLGISNVLLALAALVFMVSFSAREVVTRIVPVGMGAVAEIGARSANADYKRAIALFVATMSSNLQPATAAAVIDDMAAFFAPEIYRDYREEALKIINDPVYKQSGVVSLFVPSNVVYETTTDRVFVLGSQMMRGAGINRNASLVYEMSIGIHKGRPVVTYLRIYRGSVPETLQVLLSRVKGKVEMLPEYALPLNRRSATPDDEAAALVEQRGDIDMTPPSAPGAQSNATGE